MTESVYDQVHREFLQHAKDPAWLMAMEIYLGELAQEIAQYHQAQIQSIADQAAMRQINKAKTQITKSYLEMRLTEIRKDKTEDFKEGNWVREHGRFARWVGPHTPRENPHGSLAQDRHEVIRDELGRKPLVEQQKPQNLVGYLAKPVELDVAVSDAEHKGDVLRHAAVLTSQLESKTADPSHKQAIQFFVTNKDGRSRTITSKIVPGQGKGRYEIDWEGGERVQYMTPVGPDHPVMVAGHALNLGHVIGMPPEQAAKLGSVAQDIHDTINSTSWGKRLQAAANATRVISNNHPVAVQAHAVATLANIIGPDAARAFGPKLRQLTYRYSGQEASPEQYSQVAKDINNGKAGANLRGRENALAQDLATTLPTRAEYAASLQAGSTPPSRGFILDKNGKVVSEAVGFSDDWYAPFNLRKLPNLRGGSYVRSRGYGGITPEDLRLAMRTGAKRVTVVSNNGTFTMEFEPKALHWGHRFGFGGGAMIRRYSKSLDAVKNSKVVDPETGQAMSLNSRGYLASMHDLKMKYPFWVSAPAQSGIPYHEPLRGSTRGTEAQGDVDDKAGYIAPLNTRAAGAQAGWAETGHRELWSDQAGKYAYNSVDRYQLQQSALHQVKRFGSDAGSSSSSSSTGNADKPTGSTGGGVSGSGRSQATAYREAQQEKLNNKQMGDMFAELRGIMKRGEEEGVPEKDITDTDHVSRLHALLMAPKRDDVEYAKLREEFANSPDKRRAMLDEMDAVYGDRVKDAKSLLAGMASTINDSDEDQGAAAAAEQTTRYAPDDHIPHASFTSSEAYKRFMQELANKTNDETLDADQRKSAQQLYDKMSVHAHNSKQIDGILAQGKHFSFANAEHERRHNEANAVVARILNDERDRDEDPGDKGDDGARTTTKGPEVRTKNADHVMNHDVEDIAADHEADSYEYFGNDDEKQINYLDQVEAAYRRGASHFHKQGNSRVAAKYEKVADEINRRREVTEQYNRMTHNVEDPNT